MSSPFRRTPVEQMSDALARHDAEAVRRLLREHAQLRQTIDAPVLSFDSPAIVACAGDAGMVEVLLEFGANPNARSQWWAGAFHPLHHATGEAAERLIAAGATIDACAAANLDRLDVLSHLVAGDPARVHERGGDGQTPLHFARSREVADFLLAHGADMDARDVDHRSTPAEWMLERRRGEGRYDLARHLVARGASADIFLLAALGETARVRALLDADRSLLERRTGQGAYGEQPPSSFHIYQWSIGSARTPLDTAAQFDQPETVTAMLFYATTAQAFMFACRQGDGDAARALLARTPGLSPTTAAQHRALADAAWNGEVRAVSLMIDLGFDPRVTGHDGGTALHCAAWEGSAESVAAILRRSDARDLVAIKDARYQATPLGWCCHGSLNGNRSHDHAGVARLLIAAGAQPGPDTTDASEAVLKEL